MLFHLAKVILCILIYMENDKKKITYKVTYKWKLWKKKVKQFERKEKN